MNDLKPEGKKIKVTKKIKEYFDIYEKQGYVEYKSRGLIGDTEGETKKR